MKTFVGLDDTLRQFVMSIKYNEWIYWYLDVTGSTELPHHDLNWEWTSKYEIIYPSPTPKIKQKYVGIIWLKFKPLDRGIKYLKVLLISIP